MSFRKSLMPAMGSLCALTALLCLALAAGLFSHVPPQPVPLRPLAAAPMTAQPQAPSGIPVNSASSEDLQALPGIGPEMARRIIETREASPFFFPEDIKNVPGIGDRRFEQIAPFIVTD